MLNKIKQFLNHSNQILKPFEVENSYPLHINYLLENCFRSYDLLITIETLLKSSKTKKEHEHPIGILLRSGLYDFINFQYVSNKSIENQSINKEIFEKEARGYMNDHYSRINTSFKLHERYKSLDRFKDFEPAKKSNNLKVLKTGKEFAKQKKLIAMEDAINLWEWYSKYEHHGVFTNHIYNHVENNDRVKSSIHYLFSNIYFSLCILSDLDSSILKIDQVKPLQAIILKPF
jgi:hypothetical protein